MPSSISGARFTSSGCTWGAHMARGPVHRRFPSAAKSISTCRVCTCRFIVQHASSQDMSGEGHIH